jgi:GTP cyclohydrolase I
MASRQKETRKAPIADPQSRRDGRGISIDMVGVRGLRYPITVMDKERGFQHTVGTFKLFVNLPHRFKGTHMSRFLELLNKYHGSINIQRIPRILYAMKKNLNAQEAHLEVSFPYFIKKTAPVSKAESFMEYRCTLHGVSKSKPVMTLTVQVPITTLCPCSRDISKYGAHNQRSIVTLSVRFREMVWIEDLVRLVEDSASCEIYPLLKREDEKYVTERAYDRPMFVEDVIRSVASKVEKDPNILSYVVDSENFESIHSHNVYARVEHDKNG